LKSRKPQKMPRRLFTFQSGKAQADVANGKNGEGVGDSPETSGENAPDNEVWRVTDVGTDLAGAANQGGQAPTGEEDADDHEQGNVQR
jgi:hypothetical protein